MIKKNNLFFKSVALATLLLSASHAQTITDFSSTSMGALAFKSFNGSWEDNGTAQLIQNLNSITIASVSGGIPFGDGSVEFAVGPSVTSFLNLSASNSLTLTARSESGNLNDRFNIQLWNVSGSTLTEVARAGFQSISFTSTFSPVTQSLNIFNSSLMSKINYWTLTGNGSLDSTDSVVAFSFDNLNASFVASVPEPSTYAMISLGIMGLMVLKKRAT